MLELSLIRPTRNVYFCMSLYGEWFLIPAANIEGELITGQYPASHKREKRVFHIVRLLDLNGHHLVLFNIFMYKRSHRNIAVVGLSSDLM